MEPYWCFLFHFLRKQRRAKIVRYGFWHLTHPSFSYVYACIFRGLEKKTRLNFLCNFFFSCRKWGSWSIWKKKRNKSLVKLCASPDLISKRYCQVYTDGTSDSQTNTEFLSMFVPFSTWRNFMPRTFDLFLWRNPFNFYSWLKQWAIFCATLAFNSIATFLLTSVLAKWFCLRVIEWIIALSSSRRAKISKYDSAH